MEWINDTFLVNSLLGPFAVGFAFRASSMKPFICMSRLSDLPIRHARASLLSMVTDNPAECRIKAPEGQIIQLKSIFISDDDATLASMRGPDVKLKGGLGGQVEQ